MNIKEIMNNSGIECRSAACVSATEYLCYNTTPENVNAVLKNIGVYEDYRAFWCDDSIWSHDKTVKINRLYHNGKSWD